MSDAKIMNEALKLFANRGYEGTSVRDIAEKVGLTASAMYSHFTSKEELYFEILNSCIFEFVKDVDDLISNHDGKEKEQILYQIYIYHIKFFMDLTPKSIFVLRNMMFPPDSLKEAIMATFIDKTSAINFKIEKMLEECLGVKKVHSREFVNNYFRFIDGFIIDITARKKVFTIEEMDKYWRIYWRLIQEL